MPPDSEQARRHEAAPPNAARSARAGLDELAEAARRLGLGIPDDELPAYRRMVDESLRALDALAQVPGVADPALSRRPAPRRPAAGEDPWNAWAWRFELRGRAEGPLAGRRVVLKENVSVAGMPLEAGSRVLDGFRPDEDATVVTRALDAGATLVGTAACEDLCFSGGSHTSARGPVRNPRDPARMAGGSSGGCAALVAAGKADLAIGTDQGGSILIPSAWCGLVGLKPTHGLVPYTGILSVEPTLDHAGPIARTVADAARALAALAGADGLDPRQCGAPPPGTLDAERLLAGDAAGLRVGLLREGFGWPGVCDGDVDALVQERVEGLEEKGARIEDASVPLHPHALGILGAVSVAGASRTLLAGHGAPPPGEHVPGLAHALARGLDERAHELAPTLKRVALVAALAHERLGDAPYGWAHRARRALRAQMDAVLARHDVLALPTVPYAAPPVPPADADPEEVVRLANHSWNTAPLDLGGHPAINVPVGRVHGLPVGATLVARRFDEATLLRAARALEA